MGGVTYRSYPAAPVLANLVDCFWQLDTGIEEPVLWPPPHGSVEVVFSTTSGLLVGRPRPAPQRVQLLASSRTFGVRIRAGCAMGILGVAPGDLPSGSLDLREFWGRAASELLSRLLGLSTSQEVIALLERTLRERMASAVVDDSVQPPINRAISAAVASGGNLRLRCTDKRRSTQSQAVSTPLVARNRTSAQTALPHLAFSPCTNDGPRKAFSLPGGYRVGMRILRSGPSDQGLSGIRGCEANRVSLWPPSANLNSVIGSMPTSVTVFSNTTQSALSKILIVDLKDESKHGRQHLG